MPGSFVFLLLLFVFTVTISAIDDGTLSSQESHHHHHHHSHHRRNLRQLDNINNNNNISNHDAANIKTNDVWDGVFLPEFWPNSSTAVHHHDKKLQLAFTWVFATLSMSCTTAWYE